MEVQRHSFVYIPLHWFSKQERNAYIRPGGDLFNCHDERRFPNLSKLLYEKDFKSTYEKRSLNPRANFQLFFSRYLKFMGHVEWDDVSVGGRGLGGLGSEAKKRAESRRAAEGERRAGVGGGVKGAAASASATSDSDASPGAAATAPVHPNTATARESPPTEHVTASLGGYGLFGVELFVKDDTVIFSEVSPRPHDTGMVTMISQDLPQFSLHARAILGLPIPTIRQFGPSASSVILVEGTSKQVSFSNLEQALSEPDTQLRLFGKPEVNGKRRMGVALARAETIEDARAKACHASSAVDVQL